MKWGVFSITCTCCFEFYWKSVLPVQCGLLSEWPQWGHPARPPQYPVCPPPWLGRRSSSATAGCSGESSGVGPLPSGWWHCCTCWPNMCPGHYPGSPRTCSPGILSFGTGWILSGLHQSLENACTRLICDGYVYRQGNWWFWKHPHRFLQKLCSFLICSFLHFRWICKLRAPRITKELKYKLLHGFYSFLVHKINDH